MSQVQATGPVSLLLEYSLSDLAEPVDEDRPSQGVAPFFCLTSHAPAQLDLLQPGQDEQRALKADLETAPA